MKRIKSFIKLSVLSVLFFSTIVGMGQTASKQATLEFGALAIDRNNGFFYGWAYDQNSLAEAEKRALQESNNRGGNGTVVLGWSGGGCAAYRVIKGNVGTAYGWGLAATKAEADVIAIRECLNRSKGIPADNFVWACNSRDGNDLKQIVNDSNEPVHNNITTLVEPQGFINFNGDNTEASGSCPSSGASILTADDESLMVLFNNLPSGGTTSVNSNFFTNACSSCFAITVQDINASLTYVAAGGTFSRSGDQISFNITVKEMLSLIDGSGNSFSVSGKYTCVE